MKQKGNELVYRLLKALKRKMQFENKAAMIQKNKTFCMLFQLAFRTHMVLKGFHNS